MRVVSLGVLAALALTGAALADPPMVTDAKYYASHRTLFITPMGEAFQATESGQRGIDLWFTAADTDHDGKISRAEFLAEAMNFFVVLDANKDNSATSAESTAYWEAHAHNMLEAVDMSPPIMDAPEQATSHGPQHHDNAEHKGTTYESEGHGRAAPPAHFEHLHANPRTGAARYSLLEDAEPVMSCDANFDRRISHDEFQACADRRFTQIDLNGDGFFTPDEAASAPAPAASAAAQR